MICDTHNDFPTKLKGKSFFSYLEKCEKAGVHVIVASIYTTEIEHNNIWSIMQDIIHNILCYEERVKLLCHIEDLGFLKNEEDLAKLIALKPFSCGLVWNNENSIADKNGLTEFGKLVTRRLNESGILVDLAHANKKTFYDAADIIKKQIFVSHTGFSALVNNPRNIDDEQIKTIVQSNGFIGLFLVKKFIGSDNLDAHIEHAKKLGADAHIGIGTDYFGTKDLLKGHKKYGSLIKKLPQPILNQNFINFLERKASRSHQSS